MTPQQFLRSVARPLPVYLFLGPELFYRDRCRKALLDAYLPDPEERENGYVRHDLDEISLGEVIDDARSMSLFAGKRLLWVGAAEAPVPKGRGAETSEEGAGGPSSALESYLSDPNPSVVLVFDAKKYAFEGDDKARVERVRKFYAGIKSVVEFAEPDGESARLLLQELAAEANLQFRAAELDLMVESTGGDPTRMANEVAKLALYRPEGGRVTSADIAALVPYANETTVFALVNALARGDRRQSLSLLDALVREGEYLPLVLTFLGGLFRYALAGREAGLKSAQDVENHFRRQGVPMWRARAEQIWQVGSRLPRERLAEAIHLAFQADKSLKGARPDDRTILEDFVFRLTA